MLSTLWFGSASWPCQLIPGCFLKALLCKVSLRWGLLNLWAWLSEGSGRNDKLLSAHWGHGLASRRGLGRELQASGHVRAGLWRHAPRADTTSVHHGWSRLAALCAKPPAWAPLSSAKAEPAVRSPLLLGTATPSKPLCPRWASITAGHQRRRRSGDQHVHQDGFPSPACNLAIKLRSCLQTTPCSWSVFQRLADLAGRMGSHIWIKVFTFFF